MISKSVVCQVALAMLLNCSMASLSAAQELTLLLSIRGVSEVYPVENRSSAGYLVFSSQTLAVQVTLVNETADTIQTQPNRGWTEFLNVRLETLDGRGVDARVPFVVSQVLVRSTGFSANPLLIGPDEAQEALLQVTSKVLPAGIYRMWVSINRGGISGTQRKVHATASETFEVRDIASTNDQLNIFYSRASRARSEGRHEEARELLNQMLALRPTSVIGWYELGKVWAAARNCGQAVRAFNQAEKLIDDGADPQEASARGGGRSELRQEVRRLRESCK